MKTSTETWTERFNAKVLQGPACWLWTAYKNAHGYGKFGIGRKVYFAHRLAWEIAHGPVPLGSEVCHRCDNPWCVNPAHLFFGTQRENVQDCIRKGRLSCGEKHPGAKLSFGQVKRIVLQQRCGAQQRTIAINFRVSEATVSNIINGKSWKHINNKTYGK